MAQALTVQDKKGTVKDTNPLPVKIVEGDDILDLVQKGSLSSAAVFIVDASGNQIDDFGKVYLSGAGTNGSVTLTNANTAYAVPASAPTSRYTIVLYNGSDTDMYWGFENSNSNGIKIAPEGKVPISLGANQQVYVYCGTAGKTITYTLKEV